ncbi:MAG: hypothetical protein ACFB3T_15190 [Geminicoccaceae bacterium]
MVYRVRLAALLAPIVLATGCVQDGTLPATTGFAPQPAVPTV